MPFKKRGSRFYAAAEKRQAQHRAARKIQRRFRKRRAFKPPGPSVPQSETFKNTIAQSDLTLLNNDWHVEVIKSMSEWMDSGGPHSQVTTASKNTARGFKLNLLNTLCKHQIDCSNLGTTVGQAGVDSVIELQRVVGWCCVPINLQKSGSLSSTRAYEVDGQQYYINLEAHITEVLEASLGAANTLDFGQAGMIKSFVKKRLLLRPQLVHNHDNHLTTTNKYPTLNMTYKWNTSKKSLVQLSQPARTSASATVDTKYNMFMGSGMKWIPFYAYRVPGSVVPGKTGAGNTDACIKIRGNSRSYYKDI